MAILIFLTGFLLYGIIDQSVTLTYQKEGYANTENDLDELIRLINQTELTKAEIESKPLNHNLYEFMDFKSDTIHLERVTLIFEDSKLKKIVKQW